MRSVIPLLFSVAVGSSLMLIQMRTLILVMIPHAQNVPALGEIDPGLLALLAAVVLPKASGR